MNKSDLFNALDGLFAYDVGCTDSGIHDEALRAKVIATLHAGEDGANRLLWEFLVTRYRPEDGYTIEDAKEFIRWIEEQTGWFI